MSNEPTALYRLYDAAGTLLYVGITNAPERRWKQHADTKSWWSDVDRKTVEWLASRAEADIAEEEAIKTEKPLYNWRHADRAPFGVDLRTLEVASNRRYRVLTFRPKVKQPASEDLWVSYWDPADDDPGGITNKDGTQYVNPAWASMVRRGGLSNRLSS